MSNEPQVDYIKLLPENLFVALECCLDDPHEQVALAAAIALYSLERPVKKVLVGLIICTLVFSSYTYMYSYSNRVRTAAVFPVVRIMGR